MTPKPPDHIDRPACERRQAIPVVDVPVKTLAEKLAERALVVSEGRELGIRDAQLLLAQSLADIMAEADRLEHDEGERDLANGMRRAAQMLGVR